MHATRTIPSLISLVADEIEKQTRKRDREASVEPKSGTVGGVTISSRNHRSK